MVDAKENPPPSSILWPQFYDLKSTRKAAMAGFWTALVISVIGILFSFYIYAHAGLTKSLVVYAVSSIIMGLIAFGTLKMSRIAAYIALIVAIFKAIQDLIFLNIIGLPFSFIFLFLFIYSARGVGYYHRLKTGKEVQIQLNSRKRVRNTAIFLKRVLVISTIFIIGLYFLGSHSIYEVDLDVEAIITQNGKIIGGPK